MDAIPSNQHKNLALSFAELIETFEKGLITSRGLAKSAEDLISAEEINRINDELLSHAFWVMRHVMQRPACWAPSLEEVHYVLRCLRGEDAFSQEIADNYRR
jgi:hypothetical protein